MNLRRILPVALVAGSALLALAGSREAMLRWPTLVDHALQTIGTYGHDHPDLREPATAIVIVAVMVPSLLGAALGAGRAVTELFTPTASTGVRAAAGFAILMTGLAGLGFCGLWFRGIIGICLGAGLLHGLGRLRRTVRDAAAALAGPRGVLAAGLAALAVLLVSLPGSLEDPLVYHWSAPEEFLKLHRIVSRPLNIHWHYPLGMEMLFGAGLTLGGLPGLKSVNLALLATALLGVVSLGRALGLGRHALTGAAALMMSPAVTGHLWLGKNDLGSLMFCTAALASSLESPVRRRGGAVLFGAMAGGLAACKYTALYPLAGLAAWAAWQRPRMVAAAGLLGSAAVTGGLWPARNWFDTGNPLFPFATRWLDSPWSNQDLETRFHTCMRAIASTTNAGALTVWRDLLGDPVTLGLPLAALAPAGLAFLMARRIGLILPVTAVAFVVLLDQRMPRYLLPVLGLAAAGAAAAHRSLGAIAPRLAGPFIAGLLLAGVPLHLLLVAEPVRLQGWAWLCGRMSTTAFDRSSLTSLADLREWANRSATSGVLMLAEEPRSFGFTGRTLSTHAALQSAGWRWAHESRDARRVAVRFRQAGVTVLGYNSLQARYRAIRWDRGPDWTDAAIRIWREFAARWLVEVHRSPELDQFNGMMYVFRVLPPGVGSLRLPHPPAVLPWTEGLGVRVVLAASRAELIHESRDLLRRVPDSGAVHDLIAQSAFRLGVRDRPHFLDHARAAQAAGYSGEFSDLYAAVAEALLGRPREGFAALRRHHRLMPAYPVETGLGIAFAYAGWARERITAGDPRRACELVELGWRFQPGHPLLSKLRAEAHCDSRR